MNNELYLVDENGEVIDTAKSTESFVKVGVGDRVITRKAQNYINNSTEIKIPFIKINYYVWKDVATKYPILDTLFYYVNYGDNLLMHGNGKKMQYKSLAKVCDVSYSTFRRQMSGMIKEDIAHKVKLGKHVYVALNPFICLKGKRVINNIYKEFENSKWKDYKLEDE